MFESGSYGASRSLLANAHVPGGGAAADASAVGASGATSTIHDAGTVGASPMAGAGSGYVPPSVGDGEASGREYDLLGLREPIPAAGGDASDLLSVSGGHPQVAYRIQHDNHIGSYQGNWRTKEGAEFPAVTLSAKDIEAPEQILRPQSIVQLKERHTDTWERRSTAGLALLEAHQEINDERAFNAAVATPGIILRYTLPGGIQLDLYGLTIRNFGLTFHASSLFVAAAFGHVTLVQALLSTKKSVNSAAGGDKKRFVFDDQDQAVAALAAYLPYHFRYYGVRPPDLQLAAIADCLRCLVVDGDTHVMSQDEGGNTILHCRPTRNMWVVESGRYVKKDKNFSVQFYFIVLQAITESLECARGSSQLDWSLKNTAGKTPFQILLSLNISPYVSREPIWRYRVAGEALAIFDRTDASPHEAIYYEDQLLGMLYADASFTLHDLFRASLLGEKVFRTLLDRSPEALRCCSGLSEALLREKFVGKKDRDVADIDFVGAVDSQLYLDLSMSPGDQALKAFKERDPSVARPWCGGRELHFFDTRGWMESRQPILALLLEGLGLRAGEARAGTADTSAPVRQLSRVRGCLAACCCLFSCGMKKPARAASSRPSSAAKPH